MADSEAMCTVVVSLAPEAPVPLLLLGIRDEFTGRPQPPTRALGRPGQSRVGGADRRARRAGRRDLARGAPRRVPGRLYPERPGPRRSAGSPPVPRRAPAAGRGRGTAGPVRTAPGPGHPGPLRSVLPGLRRPGLGADAGLGRRERRTHQARAGHPRADQRRPHVPAGPRQPGRPPTRRRPASARSSPRPGRPAIRPPHCGGARGGWFARLDDGLSAVAPAAITIRRQ
jgi:hypothetical protein